MKYSLRLVFPILILLLGITVMSINMFFYYQYEKENCLKERHKSISIIGNRIANEIELKQILNKNNFSELTHITSQYTFENLTVLKIYNSSSELIFKSIPSKYIKNTKENNQEALNYVIKEKKLYFDFDKEHYIISAYFPLAMPRAENEFYTKNFGVLYLKFDISQNKADQLEKLYKYSLVNGLIILLMVAVLSLVIYIFILRRLNRLHTMAKELSKGNYSVRVASPLNDEFSEVNRAFNNMAEKISNHNLELESKIKEAVEINATQSRVMMQQNRLVAMGEMINNIAHQWRQPLNTLGLILQKLELYHKRGVLDEKKISSNIEKGMMQITKMSSTIDDFRNFFKKDKEMQVFYIKELVAEASEFMQYTIDEHQIECTINVEESTQIYTYKNELTQVLINLINNAKDALIENRAQGRWIHIDCCVENEQMIMKVADNAGGVPQDALEHIFDPYFTTKDEGEGTGIGLYMSKTIIEENMNGILSVHNNENGAVFTITLKLSDFHPFCEMYCENEKTIKEK